MKKNYYFLAAIGAAMLLQNCFTMNEKKYQVKPIKEVTKTENEFMLSFNKIDKDQQTMVKKKTSTDKNSPYHLKLELTTKQQESGLYDFLSFITLCTFPCIFNYDNKLTYTLTDRNENTKEKLLYSPYENTTTIVTAFPVLGFFVAGRKNPKTEETLTDTLDFELRKFDTFVTEHKQKLLDIEKSEIEQWNKTPKTKLESLVELRKSFTSDKAREISYDYLYQEYNKAISNYAVKQGVPRNLLNLIFCDYSECSDWQLLDIFRAITLANASATAQGVEVSVSQSGNNITISISAERNSGVRFYTVRKEDKLYIERATSYKGFFEEKVDQRVLGYVIYSMISSMGTMPAAEKMDFAFIEKMRK